MVPVILHFCRKETHSRPPPSLTPAKIFLKEPLSMNTNLVVLAEELPNWMRRAVVEEKILTLEQARDLALAAEEAEMSPSKVKSFLWSNTPEEVIAALNLRAMAMGMGDPPSIPVIIHAMDMTGYPAGRTPSEEDIDAVMQVLRYDGEPVGGVIVYTKDRFSGGFSRRTHRYGTKRIKVVSWGDDDRYVDGERDAQDDYGEESFA
jgi:hypothetical protein